MTLKEKKITLSHTTTQKNMDTHIGGMNGVISRTLMRQLTNMQIMV